MNFSFPVFGYQSRLKANIFFFLHTKEKPRETNQLIIITDLNSVSSQGARVKSSIARKPEDHPKILKW